jgi:hypothetical protein
MEIWLVMKRVVPLVTTPHTVDISGEEMGRATGQWVGGTFILGLFSTNNFYFWSSTIGEIKKTDRT